jgi:leader peptidase (prepilin peptidase)/N-methyltransferase
VTVAAVALGVFGSLIGSFLNVVVYRVPAGRSVVSPASACGSCGKQIRAVDNVPVLSWLALRGRCRACGSAISVRYPLVELGTALLFIAVSVRFVPAVLELAAAGSGVLPFVAGILVLIAFLYFAAISVALALIDLDTQTLPNVIVLPAYLVGGVLLGAAALLAGDAGLLVGSGLGAVALFSLYLVAALVKPGGMGFGDVKLAGVIGLFLGFLGLPQLLVGAFAAFVLGGLFSLGLLIARKAGRGTGIPFGPWMLGGAWVGILAGQPITTFYLGLFGLG